MEASKPSARELENVDSGKRHLRVLLRVVIETRPHVIASALASLLPTKGPFVNVLLPHRLSDVWLSRKDFKNVNLQGA